MTEVSELKRIATENNLEFHQNYGEKKMLEVLEQGGVPGFHQPMPTGGAVDAVSKEYKALRDTFQSNTNERTREQQVHYRKLFVQKTAPIKKRFLELGAKKELLAVMKYEDKHKMLPKAHQFQLNKMEAEECEIYCRCFRDPKVAGLRVSVEGVYPYRKHFDEERQSDMYTFYPTVVIEPEEQISKQLARKLDQGFMPSEDDYSDPKDQVWKFTLRESEWVKYFKEDDGKQEDIFS